MEKGLIHDTQLTLFGRREIVGYRAGNLEVREIPVAEAREYIRLNHYSGTYVNNSYIHLGVFLDGKMVGVLQFGYLMNPASAENIVPGTDSRQALELNRMHLKDEAPRNTESRAIAAALHYIKSKYPQVRFIQSFADERCGRAGVVYQACSFEYFGEHEATFYELDGVLYHQIAATAARGKRGAKYHILQANWERVKPVTLRQFRYIKFLHPLWRKMCTLTPQPYPKPEPTKD